MTYQEKGLEYIAFRAGLDALEAAQDPQWQQAIDPHTGEPVFDRDGNKVLFPVPLAQRVAPGVKRRLEWMLWLRIATYIFIGVPFFAVVLIRVAGPDWMGDWLYDTFLPIFFTGVVWVGAALGTIGLAVIFCKLVKYVFTRRL